MGILTLLDTEECVLEELKDDGTFKFPPDRPGASHCYWLVYDSVTGTLGVGRDGLPDCPGDKIFRLSCMADSVRNNGVKPIPKELLDLQPDESAKVGTKLLCQDDHVNIWEFRLAPKERCDYHLHLHPYFFLNLTESLTQELDAEGKQVDKEPNFQTQGQCTVVAAQDLSAHAVQNVGEDIFLQFVVEFPGMRGEHDLEDANFRPCGCSSE